MKKNGSVFVLVLLILLSLCTSALASTEYGVIYDETDELGSSTLTMQGEETLPQLSQALGLDLRVDVLSQIQDDGIANTAERIYTQYNYGYGEAKEGLTLTIFMEWQDEGYYAMPSDGWCIYANLSQQRGNSQELAEAVRDAVQPNMAQRAWNGDDITMSATALTQAVDAMAEAAKDYVLTNCPPSQGAPEETEAPEPDMIDVEHIFDDMDVLSYEQWEKLESQAADISQRQQCGIYFALVDDYTLYGDGSVYQVTYQLYHDNQLGVGQGQDGVIVLLSMEEQNYAMFVYGAYGEYAFNEFGQERLQERFLGEFGDADWYGGISNYLDACDEFLTRAQEGKPVRPSAWKWYAMAAGLSCLAAGAVCVWLLRGMKTVRPKVEADAYVTQDGLCLTDQWDRFSHTTVTRTKLQKESSGGSTHSESGGGGSGRSGTF